MSSQYNMTVKEKRFVGLHLIFAISALTLGSLFGPLQALELSGVDLYPILKPLIKSYYQGLTLHGVLNALIWTTFFITGFLTLTVTNGLKRPLRYPKLNVVGFSIMVLGLLLAAVPILLNEATVLYTFYPPLQANWAFYLGLVLVVVGSWVEGWGMMATFKAWRKDNKDVRSPFIALTSVITMVMWQLATIGIAVEILTMLLPWSLGLIEGVDPQLSRTYFWFTGHPLVYFWLLPAYVSWYGMLPKQAGGKLFSDTLARFSFWLFLLLSVPLGFHHQYVDPGVPPVWKFLHTLLTYSVFFPSLLTSFTVIASLERAGRMRGGRGLFGWIMKLPWKNPSVSAQILAGLLFFFGGIGGLTNASYNINLVIHNTAWVPGHLHLTVATGVTLSFMGISYWLIPYLTGKKLWDKEFKIFGLQTSVSVIQTWLWFIGMAIFSNAMHVVGLLGAPRRTPLGIAPYVPEEWNGHLLRVGIGGSILGISGLTFIILVVGTVISKRKLTGDEIIEVPIAEAVHDPQNTPQWLDRWLPWLIATIALILIAYGPQMVDQISNIQLTSPGFKVW